MVKSLGCGGMAQSDNSMQFKRAAESACEMVRSLSCGGMAQSDDSMQPKRAAESVCEIAPNSISCRPWFQG